MRNSSAMREVTNTNLQFVMAMRALIAADRHFAYKLNYNTFAKKK